MGGGLPEPPPPPVQKIEKNPGLDRVNVLGEISAQANAYDSYTVTFVLYTIHMAIYIEFSLHILFTG